MRIITVSREFGSGGREVGKRLADYLNIDYYDHEIIDAIAQEKGLNADYVEDVLDKKDPSSYILTFRNSFALIPFRQQEPTELLIAERKVLEAIAQKGRDCVIVGRNADVILDEYHPFKLFIHADLDCRIRRCIERAKNDNEHDPKYVRNNILNIDRNRKKSREILADGKWGSAQLYDLCVNTSNRSIKTISHALANYIKTIYPDLDGE